MKSNRLLLIIIIQAISQSAIATESTSNAQSQAALQSLTNVFLLTNDHARLQYSYHSWIKLDEDKNKLQDAYNSNMTYYSITITRDVTQKQMAHIASLFHGLKIRHYRSSSMGPKFATMTGYCIENLPNEDSISVVGGTLVIKNNECWHLFHIDFTEEMNWSKLESELEKILRHEGAPPAHRHDTGDRIRPAERDGASPGICAERDGGWTPARTRSPIKASGSS